MDFKYSESELKALCKKDKSIAKLIKITGKISREIKPDTFRCLISSIVSQQISTKAAATVHSRVELLVGEITDVNLLNTDRELLKSCGLSYRKVDYILGIAKASISKDVDFSTLHTLPNDELIATLSKLNGVGVWTAEMLCIFSLNRKDILSYGDLAIRNAIINLYKLDSLSKSEFAYYKELYSPYGSIASLYLWQTSGNM